MHVLGSSIHSGGVSKIVVVIIGVFMGIQGNINVVVCLFETAISMRITKTSFGSFSRSMIKAR